MRIKRHTIPSAEWGRSQVFQLQCHIKVFHQSEEIKKLEKWNFLAIHLPSETLRDGMQQKLRKQLYMMLAGRLLEKYTLVNNRWNCGLSSVKKKLILKCSHTCGCSLYSRLKMFALCKHERRFIFQYLTDLSWNKPMFLLGFIRLSTKVLIFHWMLFCFLPLSFLTVSWITSSFLFICLFYVLPSFFASFSFLHLILYQY